ncbi:hypothetical protein [Candidatus Skiveiella danica]|uniref:hypothetical protein n=1 Tax=Candidatus Skiveiella danica TaxID=3386177 RepID=UPI0039B855DA
MLYSLVALSGFKRILRGFRRVQLCTGRHGTFCRAGWAARFAEWVLKWTGTSNTMVATALAFLMAGAVMFPSPADRVRLVLRHLVNQ